VLVRYRRATVENVRVEQGLNGFKQKKFAAGARIRRKAAAIVRDYVVGIIPKLLEIILF